MVGFKEVIKLLSVLLCISASAQGYIESDPEAEAQIIPIPGLDIACPGALFKRVNKNRIIPTRLVPTALQLMRLSQDAYEPCSKHQAEGLTGPFTLKSCIDISSTSTQGFIATDDNDGSLVIAFRGTKETQDFFTDINIKAVNFNSGRLCFFGSNPCVHEGFYNAYISFYTSFYNQVCKYINRNKGAKIYITGHSLGGALATLFAYRLASNLVEGYRSRIHLYSFGTPPVGNSHFTNGLKELSLGSSVVVTIVGDAISYDGCVIGSVLGSLSKWFDTYCKPETVYYLPKKGGHYPDIYVEQLEDLYKKNFPSQIQQTTKWHF